MGARPLLGRAAKGPAADSESPSARKAAPPAGLAASLHSGPRSRSLAPSRRGLGTRGALGAQGTHVGTGPGMPLGGATTCCAPLHSVGALDTELSTTRQGRGRGAARNERPRVGAGWRPAPRAPRPFFESPPRAPRLP